MAPIQLMSGVPIRRQRLSTLTVTSPPHIQRTSVDRVGAVVHHVVAGVVARLLIGSHL